MDTASTADLMLWGPDDACAIIDATGQTSYGQLRHAAACVAEELLGLELPPGARVGLVGPNSSFWVAGYLAIMKLGLVAVPFAPALTPAEVARNASFASVQAFVGDRRAVRGLARSLPAVPPTVTEEAIRHDRTGCWPELPLDPDSDASLMFTSGTTSRPRAVRVTHRNINANTDSIIEFLGLHSDDRMLVVLPFSYCYGASLLHTHLRAGASLAICNTFTFPQTAVEMIERLECTGLAGVPSSFSLLMQASTFTSQILPSLRLIQQAGGGMARTQLERLRAAQPGARLFVMYGQTEATARLSHLPPERLDDKLGSIGRGIPGVTLQVRGEDGSPVMPGDVGEVVARGANISPGYLNDPQATAERFVDGALHTGDLATVDDEGFIYVLDRKADFIKTWGYRVSSQEVEAAALTHPDVVGAAAVGVPDPKAGEAVALFVTVRDGAIVSETSLLEQLRSQLAKHMVPEQVHLIGHMPLNANGKVVKADLRSRLVAAR